jgi:hypothetical protein
VHPPISLAIRKDYRYYVFSIPTQTGHTELSGEFIMRHPSFEGMRTDQKAKEVMKEKAISGKISMYEVGKRPTIMPDKRQNDNLR